MAIESPLFQSSMELLGHSLSHFNRGEELDRKLVILHIANSIELILKDLVLDSGESIYKGGSKETITVHACMKSLQDENMTIPFVNKIELLIDERNALQHRFGSPNELTTIFYMNIAKNFFTEILNNHYGQDFYETLNQYADEKELSAFMMREPSNETELENLKKLSKVHPLGALLSAMAYLEKIIYEFSDKVGLGEQLRSGMYVSFDHRRLEKFGVRPPDELRHRMEDTRRLRNLVAHGRKDPNKDDVSKTLSTIEDYEKYLTSVKTTPIKKKVSAFIKKRESEQRQIFDQLEKMTEKPNQ